MKFKDKLFEDSMNIAGGVFTCFKAFQREVKNKLGEKTEEYAAKLNLVSRDEFNHLLDMVAYLRHQQDLLAKKIEKFSEKFDQENNKKDL